MVQVDVAMKRYPYLCVEIKKMRNEKHEERDGDPAQDGGRDAADSENDGVGEKNGNEGAKTVPAKKDPD